MKLRNTLARALRGLPPKYRGKRHLTAHAHAVSVAKGEHSNCATYVHHVDRDYIPVWAITTPFGHGVLAYVDPY